MKTPNLPTNQPENNPNRGNGWLVLAVIALAILPLIFVRGDYGGADGEAEEAIGEIQPDYEPWFNPVLELPSGEIESLLFVSQAAIGAGVIGYVIGLYKGRRERLNDAGQNTQDK
ncbi:MAG: energy-coupling factor ABC transporter substrate-binding protein [Cyanobacteriota bacterium]|nr:energy-coupling factor ABC transporter substrate-binding protein [Cyanobacteriota bacterium]